MVLWTPLTSPRHVGRGRFALPSRARMEDAAQRKGRPYAVRLYLSTPNFRWNQEVPSLYLKQSSMVSFGKADTRLYAKLRPNCT
jgi:hypothetical protein